MKVELAAKAGFCFGVSRAVDTVYREAAEGGRPVYTYGPIIHNEEVTADLERKGVRVIGSLQEAGQLSSGTVIIRSHGVPRSPPGGTGGHWAYGSGRHLPVCEKRSTGWCRNIRGAGII